MRLNQAFRRSLSYVRWSTRGNVHLRRTKFLIILTPPLRLLGKSNIRLTGAGLGTAPIGSTKEWKGVFWGDTEEKVGIETVIAAIDSGINWIDTAPFYGWGRAERIVGTALKESKLRREDVFIFTKCGILRDSSGDDYMDLRPATIRGEIEDSLRRLQTDYVDLYQIHDVDPRVPIEDSWREIYRLVDRGCVRYAGLSNHPLDLVERAMRIGPVTSLQEQYNPIYRKTEVLFPFLSSHEVGLLSWGSLAEGFLADDFDLEKLDPNDFRRTRRNYERRERYDTIERIREKLIEIASSKKTTLASLVIAWELSHRELTGAIVGAKAPREARELANASMVQLTKDEILAFEEAISLWNF